VVEPLPQWGGQKVGWSKSGVVKKWGGQKVGWSKSGVVKKWGGQKVGWSKSGVELGSIWMDLVYPRGCGAFVSDLSLPCRPLRQFWISANLWENSCFFQSSIGVFTVSTSLLCCLLKEIMVLVEGAAC
jgi:hypothetical protein